MRRTHWFYWAVQIGFLLVSVGITRSYIGMAISLAFIAMYEARSIAADHADAVTRSRLIPFSEIAVDNAVTAMRAKHGLR